MSVAISAKQKQNKTKQQNNPPPKKKNKKKKNMIVYCSVHKKTTHENAIDQKSSLFLSVFFSVTDLSEYFFPTLSRQCLNLFLQLERTVSKI